MADAVVLFAGAASSSRWSANGMVLRPSDISLLEGVASVQVNTVAERNLAGQVPAFEKLVRAWLRVVPNPEPDELRALPRQAHPKDLSVLTAAVPGRCAVLVMFNEQDLQPGHADVEFMTPSVLVQRIQQRISVPGPPSLGGDE